MMIMQCRYSQLKNSLETLNATGIPLVSCENNIYTAAGYTDDPGIYYFIPWIAKSLGVSIDIAIPLFFGSLLLTGLILSIMSFFIHFKDWAPRVVSFCGLSLLTVAAYCYSDVYIAPYFAAASIIPLFLIRLAPHTRLMFSGCVIGYSNIIRSHAGTGVFLFILAWIFLNRDLSKKAKFSAMLILSLFVSIPYIHFHILESRRDRFIARSNQTHPSGSLCISHPKWHSIYIGFGYLANPYGIQYIDSCAEEKAKSICPDVVYCSSEYEQILRDECLLLLRKDPLFVLKTVLLKFSAICLKALKFLNISLLLLFYVIPPFRLIFPFFLAACFYMLPGILVIPLNAYLSGFVSTLTLFGVYIICLGIHRFRNVKQLYITSPHSALRAQR